MDNTEKTVEDVISQVTAQAQAQNQGEKKVLKSRIFNCMQYEVNPKTGVSLNFSEANILSCVKHKTITTLISSMIRTWLQSGTLRMARAHILRLI